VALRLDAEIVSVDSMQVYRGMNVGTAKPTVIERRGVPHYMIDVAEPEEEFSAARFRLLGREAMSSVDKPVIITGGSGLHFRALVDPMSFAPTDEDLRAALDAMPLEGLVSELVAADPEASRHVDMANKRRVVRALEIFRLTGETPGGRADSAEAEELRNYVPEVPFQAVGVDPGAALEDRIGRRLEDMRRGGLVEEVTGLRDRLGRTAASAVGYREILDHLGGKTGLDHAFTQIGQNTRKLARRQRTWFHRDPRIRWIPWEEDEQARVDRVTELLS